MKRNDILYILIPGCALVFIWIGFNIQHSAATSTIPEATSIQIQPIDPEFDTQTIEAIKQRKKVEPVLQFESNSTTSANTNSPIISPIPTEILTGTESAEATESAQ